MREFIYGYEIEAVVQEQGNARLLLVQDGEALVALKTTTTNNHKDRAQFQVEIECLKKLNHPNIIPLLNSFDDPLGFSMPYVVGDMLVDLIERESLNSEQIVTIVTSLFEALEHIHKQGILHCDLKPNNVICTEDRVPILIDFGLAQLRSKRAAHAVGSTQYMPPEVMNGQGWSVAGEIYALGLICQDMLEHSHQRGHLEQIQNIVDRCLQTEASARPASCSDVLKLLRTPTLSPSKVPSEKSTARQEKPAQTTSFPQEQKVVLLLLVMVVLGLGFLLLS